MSESSEKKLLKKTLAKLKGKAIASQKGYLGSAVSIADILKEFSSAYDELVKTVGGSPEKPVHRTLAKLKATLNLIEIGVYFTYYRSAVAFEDLQLYLSTLEEYSSQLDDTLKEIFDVAKEEMKKLEAKRKEMVERQPKYVK